MSLKKIACLALVAISSEAWAKWANMTKPVPVERLLANAREHVKENPKDAHGYYVLGRLHSLAFAKRTETLNVIPKDKLADFAPWETIMVRIEEPDKVEAKALENLKESVAAYRTSVSLDPKNGYVWLGLGWLQEEGSRWAKKLDEREPEKWKEDALAAYRKAFEANLAGDLAGNAGPTADSMISLEAGKGIQRLSKDEKELARVEKSVKELESRPRAITPIIFPLDRDRPMSDLLGGRVRFDLDGFGEARTWPWVKPDTAILVWDPYQKGKIDSGIQLFGSVTWWIFWRNGYEPLALLDDDGDGWLRGSELNGLGVWRDRNVNGVSEPGEVVPLSAAGIERISTRPDGLSCREGLILQSGRVLPTYDWTPVEVKE